jgi:hypothetical protein
MMQYESLYLPIIRKYKKDGKTLVKKLCRANGIFIADGHYYFNSTYHVERIWHDGRRYIQDYGGYSVISEAEALKADKIEVCDFAGMTELQVCIEYNMDNPLTIKFIKKQLREEPLPKE